MNLIDYLTHDVDWPALLTTRADPEPDEGGGEPIAPVADPIDDLANEGYELPDDEVEPEEDADEGELEQLRQELAEAKAERTFLRGEIAKRPAVIAPAPTQAPQSAVDRIEQSLDLDELARRITDRDPKVGLKVVMDIAKQVAQAMVADGLQAARGYTDASQVERAMKETDLSTTMAEFGDEFKLYGQPFVDEIQIHLNDITSSAGGRYIKDAMYTAAARAKVKFDRAAASRRGTTNGVTRVRPTAPANNTTTSSGEDYSKVKTISAIPDHLMSARDKAAARSVASKMGVKESEWVANYFAERANDDRFGV